MNFDLFGLVINMEARICCLVLALHIAALSLIFPVGNSRPFSSNHGVYVNQEPGQSPQSLGSKHGFQMESKQGVNEEEYSKGLSKIGSSPPSCEHKCYGCNPCEAIQVPTISKTHNHFGVNYANYEPEGWKCKCGPIFYSP
ncbi:EPIDERMAL PATTERNING FACTOR-like protein 6 isoform X1 [Mercurialis annua]|uniref:EPIDERMAL PATTERNING FACTOR-like protein 6 isoform X1 n=1 Tax=Mercurialis annua TaxID=3986 RepID=UPI0024AE7A33|nr:EPIDERMAL PATTERNING FACTOR-like protein 6 isoform X1 [Mercurialis annua]XP_055961966.1 EPIDERMAL PATTERNING FACTOR-like protein 6 isoform X1 [Mercurialis annua]